MAHTGASDGNARPADRFIIETATKMFPDVDAALEDFQRGMFAERDASSVGRAVVAEEHRGTAAASAC